MPISFDSSTARYREADGRFISERQVRAAVEKTVLQTENDLLKIARNFNSGNINLPEWKIQSGASVKAAHVLTSAIGFGGRKSMGTAEWGAVGAEIREQYKYLNRFAREIEAGRLSPTQIERRIQLYGKAVRTSFYKAQMKTKAKAGFTHCRRVLNAIESCFDCLSWSSKGFVPIEEQPPIGTLVCKSFCKCELEYKLKGK